MSSGTREQPRLEDVLEAFGPTLWRIAGVHCVELASQEDLYQEILVALWRALPNFRGESSLKTFVFRVAYNRGATHRFRVRRQAARELHLLDRAEQIADSAPAALEKVEAVATAERLRAAIAALPPHLENVTILRLEGLEADEIADVLGITTNNVHVRLHRARAHLRSILDKEDFS